MDEVGKYKNRTSTRGSCSKQTLNTCSFVAEVLSKLDMFLCIQKHLQKEAKLEDVCVPHTYQRCCHASSTEPKGLLQEGSAAGKDVKADTRRKPGHGQEAQ